jgi:hypothetical protein
MTPPPPIASFNPEQAKAAGRNYWQYFVDSLLHPLNTDTDAHPYFGLVSLAILTVISTFNLWRFFANINDGITAVVRWFATFSNLVDGGSESVDSMVSSVMTAQVQQGIATAIGHVSGAACFKFFLFFAVIVFAYMGLAFGVRRLISGDNKEFLAFTVDFGRIFAPMIVVTLLIAVFSMSGSMKLAIWLLSLNGIIFNVGFVANSVHQRKATGFDVLFAVVIIDVIMSLIVLWATKTMTSSVITGLITELAKQFGSSSDLSDLLKILNYL